MWAENKSFNLGFFSIFGKFYLVFSQTDRKLFIFKRNVLLFVLNTNICLYFVLILFCCSVPSINCCSEGEEETVPVSSVWLAFNLFSCVWSWMKLQFQCHGILPRWKTYWKKVGEHWRFWFVVCCLEKTQAGVVSVVSQLM